MGLATVIRRVAKDFNAWNGDPAAKGDHFEFYCMKRFLPEDFELIRKTPRREGLDGRRAEEEDPDFHFEHRRSRHRIWVECKYRGQLSGEKLAWSNEDQLRRYKAFEKRKRPEEVYVVIGLGGASSWPDSVFCIPLAKLEHPDLHPSNFEPFRRRDPRASFEYIGGVLR